MNAFKPAWWLRNSHLQTIWPVLCRPRVKDVTVERERVELPDGDFIDLDWVGRHNKGPLALILHGFEGSINSHYGKSTLKCLKQRGWRGVFMHFRGCSGEPNRLPRSYHSGETNDVEIVVKLLREREPNTPMVGIGYSLGGNVLLKWLGETRENNPLRAAIAVSVPYDLHKAAKRIQSGFSRFYQWYFLRCLRGRLMHKFQFVPSLIDPNLLLSAQTLKEFDNIYTAPLHGFSDVDDYYNSCSSRRYLKNIQVPTLLLHSKDDPFMSEDIIPAEDELSPSIKLEVTETGGHVGFISGKYPWRPEYWLEYRIPQFLATFLKGE